MNIRDRSGPCDALSCRAARFAPQGRSAPDAVVISLWRLPVFGLKLRNVLAFLVPALSTMATQVADAARGYRISCERVLASVAGDADSAALLSTSVPVPPSGNWARHRSGIHPELAARGRRLCCRDSRRASRRDLSADHPARRQTDQRGASALAAAGSGRASWPDRRRGVAIRPVLAARPD